MGQRKEYQDHSPSHQFKHEKEKEKEEREYYVMHRQMGYMEARKRREIIMIFCV